MSRVLCLFAAMLFGIGTAYGQQGNSKGPPLETRIPSPSENGQYDMLIVYHANGTFDMRAMLAAHSREWTTTGIWWWAPDGRFCFKFDSGTDAGKEQCKGNGHLIGRVDYQGRVAPP